MRFPLPSNLVDSAGRSDQQRSWLAGLPKIVEALTTRWALEVDGPFEPGGHTAWVAPVRSNGANLVLKVAWRHDEARHEADALRLWNGDGAVRLYASVELGETIGLLIERCVPGTSLASVPEPQQDVIVAALLPRLWQQPPPGSRFRPLQEMCNQWARSFEHKMTIGKVHLDRGLARDGIALFRMLPGTADRNVVLCTDLHAENILASQREAWLAIDPKPYVGDPTYDALQHLLNCEQRLEADPHSLARRMADLLGLDAERLLLWLFARCVQESPHWPFMAKIARRIAPS